MHRRTFLRYAGALAGTTIVGGSLWQEALAAFPAATGPGPYGPLLPPDANGLKLPAGFSSRELARGTEVIPGIGYEWHIAPDGGAVFPDTGGGWIYVSNSEFLSSPDISSAGTSAMRFDSGGNLVDAYRILGGTLLNCAGGATPWGTWLSCEEHFEGLVWECDPQGVAAAVSHPAMGRFSHEAAAADGDLQRIYLTEDQSDSRLYRFTPNAWGNLSTGSLEVANVDGSGNVTWLAVPRPDPADPINDPTRYQVPASTPFDGGEGIVYAHGHVYFTTKGDNRVWDYVPYTETISVLYDAALDPGGTLTGVDNVAIATSGDLVIGEDKTNDQQLVVITPDGVVSPLVEMNQQNSEFTGPAFDLSGTRLYFSSQRGPGVGGRGITYEVTGPFRTFRPRSPACAG